MTQCYKILELSDGTSTWDLKSHRTCRNCGGPFWEFKYRNTLLLYYLFKCKSLQYEYLNTDYMILCHIVMLVIAVEFCALVTMLYFFVEIKRNIFDKLNYGV